MERTMQQVLIEKDPIVRLHKYLLRHPVARESWTLLKLVTQDKYLFHAAET